VCAQEKYTKIQTHTEIQTYTEIKTPTEIQRERARKRESKCVRLRAGEMNRRQISCDKTYHICKSHKWKGTLYAHILRSTCALSVFLCVSIVRRKDTSYVICIRRYITCDTSHMTHVRHAFQIPYRASWYVITYQGFLNLKYPVWVPVRAQKNGHRIIRAAAATDHSLISATEGWKSEPIVARTKPVCKHRDRDPRSGLWQPPPRLSNSHFSEREPTPGISISRLLGMGSYTKMGGMGSLSLWDSKRKRHLMCETSHIRPRMQKSHLRQHEVLFSRTAKLNYPASDGLNH